MRKRTRGIFTCKHRDTPKTNPCQYSKHTTLAHHIHAHGIAGAALEAQVNVAARDGSVHALELTKACGGRENTAQVLEPLGKLNPFLDLWRDQEIPSACN